MDRKVILFSISVSYILRLGQPKMYSLFTELQIWHGVPVDIDSYLSIS